MPSSNPARRDIDCLGLCVGGRLRGKRLDSQDLSGIDFGAAELHGASLRGTSLAGADLSRAAGLTPEQVAGADLRDAVLPGTLAFPGVEAAKELASKTETRVYFLLATCTTLLLFLSSLDPSSFFIETSSVTVPVVQLPVPVRSILVLAPLLITVLYARVALAVRKFAVTVSELPARFPNHLALDQHFMAWTPNPAVLACTRWRHLRHRRESTAHERMWLILLVWWTAPAALSFIWASSLQTHDRALIAWHTLSLAVIGALGVDSYRSVTRLFETPPARKRRWARVDLDDFVWPDLSVRLRSRSWRRGRAPLRAVFRQIRSTPALALALGLAAAALSWGATSLPGGSISLPLLSCTPGACWGLGDAHLAHAGLQRWPGSHRDLRRADLRRSNLRLAALDGADLREADLNAATLIGADLENARLDGAVLRNARLDSAALSKASLVGTDLRGASFAHSQLSGADLRGANFIAADLTGALVCGARFDSTTFTPRQLLQLRGLQFANAQLRWIDQLLVDSSEVPDRILEGNASREYSRWLRAWRRLYTRLSIYAGDRLQHQALSEAISRVDVSMGEDTQRMRDHLLDLLDAAKQDSAGAIGITPAIVAAYDTLRARVRTEAQNHCVDVVRPQPDPENLF